MQIPTILQNDTAYRGGYMRQFQLFSRFVIVTWLSVLGLPVFCSEFEPPAGKMSSPDLTRLQKLMDFGNVLDSPPEPLADDPILHLPLDEASGATAFADTSGYGYSAWCSGGTCPAAGQAGIYGNALAFDGSDDYIQVPHYSAFDFGTAQDFTVMLWVKSGNPHAWGSLVSNKSAWHWVTCGFIVAFWQDGATWTANAGDGVNEIHVEGGKINDNKWHHLAATFDRDGNLTIYQDLVAVGSISVAGVGNLTSGQPLNIGRLWDGSTYNPYAGLIEDIRIYNRVLTLSEIATFISQPCTVTSSSDLGTWTLREKLADLTCSPITFSSDMTIYLESQLDIRRQLTVDGTGHSVTLSGSNLTKVLDVRAPSVTLKGLTIRDGVINDCSVEGGWNNMGAGVHAEGSGNSLTLVDCTVTDNVNGPCYGGGIWCGWCDFYMDNCTVRDNTVGGNWGGGLMATGAWVGLRNTTFASNHAGAGGGIFNDQSYMGLQHCTLVWNCNTYDPPSGSGICNRGTSSYTVLQNTIVAESPTGFNCGGTPFVYYDSTGNLDDDGTCNSVVGGFNQTPNLFLGTLGSYGGTTATVPLLPGSAAIDAGTASKCFSTDQRGYGRVGQCDVGAFESQGFTINKTGGDNQSATVNTPFWAPLAVHVTSNDPLVTVNGGGVFFTPPSSGASALIDGNPATISMGNASVLATANGTAGTYDVAASAGGSGQAVNFSLTNLDATAPPPVGNGKNSTTKASFSKRSGAPNIIDVTYDALHCSSRKAVIYYGSKANYASYLSCALGDAGNTGTASFDSSALNDVWFNIVWTDGTTAGHPGYAFNGSYDVPRTWLNPVGKCGETFEDRAHETCP